jgi:hypothetical protein
MTYENGENVLNFKTKPSFMKLYVRVEIFRDVREISMLAALGMYLLKIMHDEATMVSIMASA